MEKRTPHYPLKEIQAQMKSIVDLHLTKVARRGIRDAGMEVPQALEVVKNLTSKCFYKSMTSYNDHRVWQDVYHAEWAQWQEKQLYVKQLYVKFQKDERGYFTISFKER